MFRVGVGIASPVAVFALTGPAGAYDLGAKAEAVAMAKRVHEKIGSATVLGHVAFKACVFPGT
jgi:hypothetical protein